MSSLSFGAVFVTYNRIDHLRKSIRCYTAQTYKPERIVVVDNCSIDGTREFLESWLAEDESVHKEVIFLKSNTGGSGGFYSGLEAMQKYEDIDWIWVADDDAYPEVDAFEKARDFINERASEISGIAAVCGVCGSEGNYSNIQRFRLKKTVFGLMDMPIPQSWYEKNVFDIDMYSFVGTFLNRNKLLMAGLPRKDFFIYQDDLEHSIRMKKTGRIVCTTSIKITHVDNTPPADITSWRDYYASRNIVVMYKEHFDKWSYFWRIVRRRVFAFISFKPSKIKVVNAAIKDGIKGNMGIHPIYKPGWKA